MDEKKTFRGHACAPDGLSQLNIKPDFLAKDLLSICDLWVLRDDRTLDVLSVLLQGANIEVTVICSTVSLRTDDERRRKLSKKS